MEADLTSSRLIEQPFKIPFAAAVIFYANDNDPKIATAAFERVTRLTQEALNDGQWKQFKLLLRFFACLQSVFDGDGIFTLLQQLFDTVVDLQSANENDVRPPVSLGNAVLVLTVQLGCRTRVGQNHTFDLALRTRLRRKSIP